eukprot:COSAG02_NODE_63724_length_262_cov_0.950920_1_plen_26_part_10
MEIARLNTDRSVFAAEVTQGAKHTSI